jgi:prolyl-tRNA synthetase
MRYSQYLIPTLKEVPAEAVVASHQLLLRAGFIRKLAAGIYNLLPLGKRTVAKVERIIREEMDRAGAHEILMPSVQPAELWEESGRWQQYGPELLRFRDRKEAWFCLGPTHEEVVTDIVRREVRSYRQLPLNLYQVQSKFRDEIRPRFGLMRGREFIMKDAYSFDVDAEHAKRSYAAMYEAYRRIFKRCGLEFRAVEADTGNIGGSMSHEFQVLAESGEDQILACDRCTYAANVEKAELRKDHAAADATPAAQAPRALEKVKTPKQRTVDEVTAFLGVPATQLAKTLIYLADGQPVAVMVRGDFDANPLKVKGVLGATDVVLAGDDVVVACTKAPPGFAGPVGLSIPIVVDASVRALANMVTGANEVDAHYVNVNLGRDFEATHVADVRAARAGDACARCDGGHYETHRGIEVGHVFFLGTKYSDAMRCTFLDAEGKERPMVMGCYGIGVTRTMSAAIEQGHDADGIRWPITIAPFHVLVSPLQMKDAAVVSAAEQLYGELGARGVEVLLDDRDERPGIKFKDADLLGIPLRVTIGQKGLAEGKVEVKRRTEKQATLVALAESAEWIVREVEAQMAAAQP